MKKYIDFNTEKRMDAANDFEKDFFKLMINSVYGKRMENLRKRISVWLVNIAEDFWKYTSKPTYITHKIFGKDYAAIHEIKPVLMLRNQFMLDLLFQIYVNGRCMTSIYNFIKRNFDLELLFTGTDRLTYEIKSEDV